MESIFENNPNLKEVFVTSDGECFYKADDAKNHAKTLTDKAIENVQNPLLLKEALQLDQPDTRPEDIEVAGAEVVTEATTKADETAKEKKPIAKK